MSGQSNYLPAGLPHNRALWPVEYQEKEQLDLAASRLIKQLRIQKIHRDAVLVVREAKSSETKIMKCNNHKLDTGKTTSVSFF